MHYVIRHHVREISYDGHPYFVTRLFRSLIEGLRTRYPAHTFDVQVDDTYESCGYGGIHSCMHLSVWHPGTRKYILVSLFDNWRHHFDRSLGWEPDRMVQFFYGGGFDFAEYFQFRQLRHSNPNLVFPEDISSVYRELSYVPFCDGLDADMEDLYLWPKRPPSKMLFRGWLWEPRKLMVGDLQRDDIVIIDTNAGGERLGVVDYLTEMTEYAAVLSLPGGAPLCNRDIEAFAVGVPVIRPYMISNHSDPLLPGVHYICCYHQPHYGDDGYARYLSYRDFQHHLVRTWDRVKDDREFLSFIAANARAWYVRNCTMDQQLARLLEEMDLDALGAAGDVRPRVAICLTGEPRGIETCVDSLYENIVEPLDASIFYSFNRATPDDESKIKLINKKLIFGELKEKADLRKELVPDSLFDKLDEIDFDPSSNWIGTINKQRGGVCYRHLDFRRMAAIVSDCVNQFDYFIVTRSDFRYLFPIFDFSILNEQEIIKHKGADHDAQTGMNWEFIICKSSKVLEFLNSPYLFMNNESLQDLVIKEIRQRPRNNESFQRIISEYYNWNVSEMEINGFISADTLEESTTWGMVQHNDSKQVLFKYSEMTDDAYRNLDKRNRGLRWTSEGRELKLT
jgi:hypothetical protein